MDITVTLKKAVKDATWQQVVIALAEGMHNIPRSELDGGSLDDFLQEHSLSRGEVVFMGTNSIGGRRWTPVEDRAPVFFPDPHIWGGWEVLSEGDSVRVELVSATSLSSLTAERQSNKKWTVTLEVPVLEGGQPYEGVYWGAFHSVFYQALVL